MLDLVGDGIGYAPESPSGVSNPGCEEDVATKPRRDAGEGGFRSGDGGWGRGRRRPSWKNRQRKSYIRPLGMSLVKGRSEGSVRRLRRIRPSGPPNWR